ncbi:LysM peptidoglycan-binding domain-containing protein [Listeria kieliensis]
MNKNVKKLVTGTLALGLVVGSPIGVLASNWKANTPDQIHIQKGQKSYQLRWGDTLWGISQKVNIKVDKLAEINKIDLAKKEEYSLPVGRTIEFAGAVATVKDTTGKVVAKSKIEKQDKVNPNQPVGSSVKEGTPSKDTSVQSQTGEKQPTNNSQASRSSAQSNGTSAGKQKESNQTNRADKPSQPANNGSSSGTTTKPGTSTPNNNGGNQSANKPAANLPTVAKMKLAQRTDQIVTVVASGSSAQVKLWQKANGTWKQSLSTAGHVGSQGVGTGSEYASRTPRGAYGLSFAFGTHNPGTKLPFRTITKNSYWISNVNDPQYNTWQERSNGSSSKDEHLADYPTQYEYAMALAYNNGVGGGSAIFLHVDNGRPTAGCISVPRSSMQQLMRTIHSGAYIVNVNSENELLNY